MSKFYSEFKKFFSVFKYAIAGGILFYISILLVDKYGAESTVAVILSVFWLLVLLGIILYFSGLGYAIVNGLKKLFTKKNDLPNKEG